MMVPRPSLPRIVCLFLVLCAPTVARGARITDLASAFDKDDPYDANILIGYHRQLRRGAINRELSGNESGVSLAKDLRFSHIRQTLNVRADLAVWHDLQIHVEFPIVLSDVRAYSFAQNGGDPCGEGNCVNKYNSSMVRDGYFDGSKMGDRQIKVAGPKSDGPYPGGMVLPVRKGLDQIYLGITWAPVSQARDVTKPTWTFGFEARIGVGDYMRYNPNNPIDGPDEGTLMNPKTNDTVSQGLHQFMWTTTFSKRFNYVDPYMNFFYIFPLAKKESLFYRTSFDLSGQERHDPSHHGGVDAGMEIIAWRKPEQKHQLTIELAGRLEGIFEGRQYTDIWELFANSPKLMGGCVANVENPSRTFDDTAWNNGIYCARPTDKIPFPGITSVENHILIGSKLAFNLDMTQYIRVHLGVGFSYEQDHYITFGDLGSNVDDESGVQHDNDHEVNPMYRPYIDATGRRYRIGDTTIFDVFASVQGRF